MGSYPAYRSRISFFLMFIKNYHILFLTLLISGTLIAISSNSWFTAWLGLEINLISIIPLMLTRLIPRFSEARIKYFLSQAMASVILIFSISVNFLRKETLNLELIETFLTFALALKRGLAPFHFWFPQVVEALAWPQCLIILTWQKVAPLILISSLRRTLIIFLVITSALVGAFGGFNQILIKIVLTYSSISHRAWIVMACSIRIVYWLGYFIIYSFISFSILLFFIKNNIEKTREIFSTSDSGFSKVTLIFNTLSLGGLPPLLGFAAKLNIIILTLEKTLTLVFIPLILRSLISLFFYTRVIYSNIFFRNKKFIPTPLRGKPISLFFMLSLFRNVVAPAIFLL